MKIVYLPPFRTANRLKNLGFAQLVHPNFADITLFDLELL